MAYSSDVWTFPCNQCPKVWTRFEHATFLHQSGHQCDQIFDFMFNKWPLAAIKMTKN